MPGESRRRALEQIPLAPSSGKCTIADGATMPARIIVSTNLHVSPVIRSAVAANIYASALAKRLRPEQLLSLEPFTK
jgi:hypothetical protein